MSIFGCDYSYSRDSIDIAGMARDGVKFACRYLRDGGKAGKALLPSEATRLTKAGIAIVSNDETTGTQYLGGFDGGRRDAQAALAAHVACGGPSNGRPIYFTPLDHDPASLDANGWDLLRGYARGVVDVLGVARTGWYGGTQMLRWLKAGGRGAWWWQSLGWRQGVWLDWVHLQQYDNGNARWNGQVDYDRALTADYGQWGINQEATMPLDATDKQYLDAKFAQVQNAVTGTGTNLKNIINAARDDVKAVIGAEENATQAAIANLQLAAVDPVTLAAALDPLIGADLADKVAAELATRLQS